MKKTAFYLALALVLLFNAGSALAAGGYPWNNHVAPYDFLFDNHIDTHQQSQLIDKGNLQGFLYIHYTGESIDGIPVAEHTDCSQNPEDCVVGWILRGIPAKATWLADSMGTWCINPESVNIPKGYTLFHWLGLPETEMGLEVGQQYPGYLMTLISYKTFYFRHHGMLFLITPGVDSVSHSNITTNCGE